MKKLLALDISSSTIGWAVFSYNNKTAQLDEYGYFKPLTRKKAKEGKPERVRSAEIMLEGLLDKYKIDEIAVEDYAKGFSSGRSTANTIILLAIFNETCCLASFKKTGKNPERYAVATIRSVMAKHFGKKNVSKDDVLQLIIDNCSRFKVEINRAGNVRVECGDIADAIAVGITAIKDRTDNVTWKL